MNNIIIIAGAVFVIELITAFAPLPHAAQMTGHYVTLLAVSDDGRVSAVDDKLPGQCQTLLARLREIGGFKFLDCVPIDYEIENRRR